LYTYTYTCNVTISTHVGASASPRSASANAFCHTRSATFCCASKYNAHTRHDGAESAHAPALSVVRGGGLWW